MPVSPEDRERVAELMSQPASAQRDIEVEAVLGKYFDMLVTVEPVPLDHLHDGKRHEGIEIHFRPGARAGAAARDGALDLPDGLEPVSAEETFGDAFTIDDGFGSEGEGLGIIGGCTDPPRTVSPDDPTAQLCYLDPPGICRYC
jgi:hypothetical protein